MHIKRDRFIGIMILLIGVLFFVLTSQIKPQSKPQFGDVGPKVFPFIATTGLMITGIGIFLVPDKDESELFSSKGEPQRIVFLAAILLTYIVAMYYLGYLISTPIFAYVMVSVLAIGKKVRSVPKIVFATALTVTLYLIFVKIMYVQLPYGRLLRLLMTR